MQDKRSRMMTAVVILAACGLATSPAPASPGDFDGDGYVGIEDLTAFVGCMAGPNIPPGPDCEPADFDDPADNDVDLVDLAAFQALAGHTDIPLMDRQGNPIQLASLVPYSPRQSCGVLGCHDLDEITNAYHFQQGRTDADGNMIMQDDFFGDGRFFMRSPGMFGKW